ncbi:MAG: bifunctional ornithine acetyltransferase/N-acetylglutamate synthase, partial [Nitrospirales bacterium]
SGMIHPDLATMLAYLTTDAAIEQEALQRALAVAVDASFHRITVDGDSSPNDTVLCLANGRAGNRTIRTGSPSYRVFQRLLERACLVLAQQIVHDGEGATKVVKVVVRGAGSPAEARRAAAVIATSSLVKTAWFGEDANWGRILAAVGRAGVRVHPGKVGLWFEGEPIVTRGVGRGAPAERRLSRIVKRKTFTVEVDLGVGRAASWLWTTDLSFDYVRINASYRT